MYLFSPNKIKAVLFDLDGTLRHHLPVGGDVFVEYLRNIGLTIPDEDAVRATHWDHFYFANSLEIQQDGKTYKDDRKGFWVNYSKRRLTALGIHPTQANELAPKISAYMAEAYKPEVVVPEDAFTLLAFLKQSKYIVGLVSNREEPYQDELQELKLDIYFDFSLAGGEVNSYKPDKPIFDRALELSGTAAHETIFIGDNYFADIAGSHHAGLIPVLYDPGSLFPEANCTIIKSFSELHQMFIMA